MSLDSTRSQEGRLEVAALPIDPVTLQQALARIANLVDAGRGGSVFTPNVDHVVMASKNAAFRRAYRTASLSLADGMPVVWASRLLGTPVPEKVSGSDLVEPLAAMAAARGFKVFLLGGAPGVGDAAAEALRGKYPALQIVGIEAPQIDSSKPVSLDLLRRIRQSGAQILLVAFGAPKQELFIEAATPGLGPCVAIGVGASLDFLAGRAKRSPAWMSRHGLEWLHRLVREPRRLWRRYLIQDPVFVLLVLAQLARRWRGPVVETSTTSGFGGLAHRVFNQLRWHGKHLLDLGVVIVCMLGAAFLNRPQAWPTAATFWFTGALAALWVFVTTLIKHYDMSRRRSFIDDVAIISVLALLLNGAVALAAFLVGGGPSDVLPGAPLFLTLFWPTALLVRVCYSFSRYRPDHAPDMEEIVVLGTSPLARITKETMDGRLDAVVLGFIPMRSDGPRQVHGPILGAAGSLEQVLREFPVTEVYIAGNMWKQGEEIQEAVQTCERFGVNFALPVCGFRLDRARPLRVASRDGYQHFSCVHPRVGQLAVKRLLDILGSAFGLLMLSPLLISVAVLVKLTSKGPILFRQCRSGLHGRKFNMLKFRSMVINAEALQQAIRAQNEQAGPVFKMRNDPRITPIGRFLRKFSIDELPQLLNVLRGDMSLVGPRPPVPSEVAQYQAWQRRRLSMRPGLTCTWQVSGRNELSFTQWMYLDMQYIDHWSLAEDLKLLLRTVPVVFTGRGAS